MHGVEYATIAIDRSPGDGNEGARWVARSNGGVLAMGKRITEVVDHLRADAWEVIDLNGGGARLQRPA